MKSPAESLNFRQSLLKLLEAGPDREEKLLEQFEQNKGRGDSLYAPLLYLLTHLDYQDKDHSLVRPDPELVFNYAETYIDNGMIAP